MKINMRPNLPNSEHRNLPKLEPMAFPQQAIRKPSKSNSAVLSLILLLLLVFLNSNLSAQFAKTGSGYYKNQIFWLPWTASKLAEFNKASGSITWTKDDGLADGVEVKITIAALSGDAKIYTSGTGANDTFDDLYGGLTNNSIATADNSTLTRTITMTMTLNGNPISPNLVFADAENSTEGEYTTLTRQGTEGWHFLEGWDRATEVDADYLLKISGSDSQTATTQSSGTNILSPVGTYTLLAPNISSFNLEIKGAVTTAVALGVFLPVDYADALNYSTSGHLINLNTTSPKLPVREFGINIDNDGQIYPGKNPGGLYWPISLYSEKVHLGFSVDADSGYTANDEATGDDLSGTDDEDGVWVIPDLSINLTNYSLNCYYFNNSGADANLYAWIDFNRDGHFEDSEMINNGIPISLSSNNVPGATTPLTWDITKYSCATGTIKAGRSYMRIRLTTNNLIDGSSTEDGRSIITATDGEVEDYMINIMGFDYSDLPSSYGTASATVNPDSNSDGKPDMAGSIWLGNVVDYNECSSLSSIDAKGDDNDGLNDDDGLVTPTNIDLGTTSNWTITLNSQASVADVQWGIWLDWNNNGSFGDAGDGFYSGKQDVASLTQVVVPVAIPNTNIPRVATRVMVRTAAQGAFAQSEYNSTSIVNGEVEDYFIEFPLKAFIVTQKNIECFGGNNGEVTVDATGGTPPYQFSIDNVNFLPLGVYTNLTAGNYTVYVKDNVGASVTVPVNITQTASAVTATISTQNNILCFGETKGSATVTAAGGVAPYRFYFNGETTARTDGTFTNLPEGTYPVLVRDANNCEANATITITAPPVALGASATQVNVGCFGDTSGSFNIVPTGGTSPYTYSIDGISFQTSPAFTGLAANTYNATVKDVNNCTYNFSVTLTQPSELKSSPTSITDVKCFGANTGSATILATGGTPPYQYSIDNGANFDATGVFSNLFAGTYFIIAKDANGCQVNNSLTIAQPTEALIATVSNQQNIDCFGNNNGTADVTATGGTAPYRYYFNGETTPRASGAFTNLSIGNYPVLVRDANDCEANTSIQITGPTEALSASATKIDVKCFNSASGSFTVIPIGGTSPYTYSIDGVLFQASPTFTALAANTYNVSVKDLNNCSFNFSVTILQPDELKASLTSITNVKCFGANTGSATILATGGTPPYQYSIDNGANFNSTGVFSNLFAGNYNIVVKDANDCQITNSLTISQPAAPLSATITTQSNVNCFGDGNGSALVTASGGIAPYRYFFNGEAIPRVDGTFTNLAAGSYPVIILDANDCQVNQTITISQPTAPLSATAAVTNVDCFGSSTGSFTINATGGTSPYTYSIDGGTVYQSLNLFPNQPAGVYPVKVKDANGCTFDLNATVTQPTELMASVSSTTDVACFGASTGVANITATGGTTPYQFSIDNGTSFNTTGSFANLPAGSYTVLTKDANNCQKSVSLAISQPSAPLQGSIALQTNIDCNTLLGAVNIQAVGGTSPYTFSLNGATPQPSGMFTNLAVGNYAITIADNLGCTTIQNVAIIDQTNLNPNLVVDNQTICKNSMVKFTASGGNEFEFSINGTIVQARSSVTTYNSSTLSDGDIVRVEVYNNTNGCHAPAQPITMRVNPIPVVTLPTFSDICTNTLPLTLSGGLPIGGTYTGSGITNGVFNPATAGVGTHTIVYTYRDVNGCSNSASTTIVVENCNLTLSMKGTFNDANGDGHAQVGETITYQFTVTNSGTSMLTNISITNPKVTVNGSLPSLAAGASNSTAFTATYILTQAEIDIAKFTTQSIVNATKIDGATISDLSDDPSNPTNVDPDNDGDPDDQTITALNVYPIAVNDPGTTNEDNQIVINVTANDNFGGNGPSSSPIRILTAPLNGTAVVDNGGTPTNPKDDKIVYNPKADFNGTDSFTYEICDSDGDCVTATINVIINAINDAPSLVNDDFSTIEFQPIEGNVLTNDSDVDNLHSELTVSTTPTTRPTHGTLELMADGNFIYTPKMDFVGQDYFEYEVCDNGTPKMCSTARVMIEIGEDNSCQVLVPNGFSPDGDGIGDVFKIRCLYRFPDAHLQVFSRWGSMVYEKEHYGNSDFWTGGNEWWDGRSNNKWAISSDLLPAGTYVYILKLGNGEVKKGTVFLAH